VVVKAVTNHSKRGAGRGHRLGHVVTTANAAGQARPDGRPDHTGTGLDWPRPRPGLPVAAAMAGGVQPTGPDDVELAFLARRAVPSPARRGCRREFMCDVSMVTILQAFDGLRPEGTVVGVAERPGRH
jgi:hypothetical protein